MNIPLRVLIIDDSENDAFLLVNEIERAEFKVTWKRVYSMESLRTALSEQSWDIVFSDHSIPGFGGRDALALVKEQRLDVPFIVLSGAISQADAIAAMKAGAQDYIGKDDLTRLIPVIERELRTVQERRERRQLEVAQRESQARKSAMLDSALDCVVTIDHEGRIFEWNPASEKTFGYCRTDVLGKELATLIIPPALRERHRQGLAHFTAARPGSIIGKRVEMTALRSDGTEFPVEMSVARVPSEGDPIFTGFIRDITERKRAEAALRKNEATLVQAQRIAHVGSWEVDVPNETLDWSEETYRIFGRVPGEFTPSHDAFYAAVHPDDRGRVKSAAETALRSGKAYDIEHRVLRPDGSERIVQEQAEVFRDAEGRAVRMIGVVQDITERRRSEEALRQSEERFSRMFRASPVGISLSTLADGRLLDANDAFLRLFGYSRPEAIGRTSTELGMWLHPEDHPRLQRQLLERAAIHNLEHEFRTNSGEVRHALASLEVIEVGHEKCVLTLIHDITARKRAEEALRRTEELYRRAITAADAVPYLRDYGTDSFTFIGEGIERLTGYSSREITPQLWQSLVRETVMRGEAARWPVEEAIRRARSGEIKHWQSDCIITTRDGSKRWVADSSIEIAGEHGGATGSIGILMDITGRRQMEEQLRQLQKMESIGQLAAGVAHDFNNILAVIQGHADLLVSGIVQGGAAEESAKQISAAARRATNLTRQLLAFSRKQKILPQDMDLNEVVKGMTKMIGRLLGAHIDLQLVPAPRLPAVHGDFGMIEQILLNLAVNARDAMPGGGQLVVRTDIAEISDEEAKRNPEARPGSFVRLAVTDTGCGIPAEILPRIFEPFFTTKAADKGTGLGLATVYGIVKQHRGWIEIESRVEHGTTFTVFLPAGAPGAKSVAEPPSSARVRGHGETILIAEDEPALRRLAARILQGLGYEVLEAASGVEAIRVWDQHGKKVDLLLTDLVMPDGLTGRELAKQVQGRDANLKVIYTSGYNPQTNETGFVFRESMNFLQKPYAPAALAQAVRDCLDRAG